MRVWVSHEGSDTQVAFNPKLPCSIHMHTNLGWVRVEVDLRDGETMEQAAERVAASYELTEIFPEDET